MQHATSFLLYPRLVPSSVIPYGNHPTSALQSYPSMLFPYFVLYV